MPRSASAALGALLALAVTSISIISISGGVAALDASLLPRMNTSFVFDGAHSDLAQQLYHRSRAGDELAPLNLATTSSSGNSSWLPDALRARLERSRVPNFDLLPGLLQRALLWDTGFVLVERSDRRTPAVVQVWTVDGRPMSDLAVSKREWEQAETIDTCALTTCVQPTGAPAYKAFECACDARAALVAKCAVADTYRVYDDAAQEAGELLPALWVTGGADPSAVPDPILREHSCGGSSGDSDSSSRIIRSTSRASIFSIDTTGANRNRSRSSTMARGCASAGFESLMIPCLRVARVNSTQRARLREPMASPWVDDWLIAFLAPSLPAARDNNQERLTPDGVTTAAAPVKSFNMALLVIIVVGSLFAIAVVGLLVVRRTGARDNSRGTAGVSSIDVDMLLTPRRPKRAS